MAEEVSDNGTLQQRLKVQGSSQLKVWQESSLQGLRQGRGPEGSKLGGRTGRLGGMRSVSKMNGQGQERPTGWVRSGHGGNGWSILGTGEARESVD